MRKIAVLLTILLLPIAAADTVETRNNVIQRAEIEDLEGNLQVSHVEPVDRTLYGFELNGSFNQAELRVNSSRFQVENINLRIADDQGRVYNPTNFTDFTVRVNSPGKYYLIKSEYVKIGYNSESRNCFKFFKIPEDFEEVEECPEEAGTMPVNNQQDSYSSRFLLLIIVAAAILGVVLVVLYVRARNSGHSSYEDGRSLQKI